MATTKVLKDTAIKIGENVLHETAIPQKNYQQSTIILTSALTKTGANITALSGIGSITINITKKKSLVFIQGSLYGSVNREVGNIVFLVNGLTIGRFESTNTTSIVKVTPFTIIELDEGTHVITMGAYTQSSNSTLTIPAWTHANLIAYEI